MRKINRRNFLKVTGVLAAASALAACGGSSTSTAGSTGSTAGSAAGADGAKAYNELTVGTDNTDLKADLKFVSHRTDLIEDGTFDGYVAAFQKLYPNITIKYEGITDYATDMTTRLTSNDWGDLCMIPTNIPLTELGDYFEPLCALSDIENDYNFASNRAYNGSVYGIPSTGNAQGIIYNKKIIKDYCAKSYAVIKSADDIKDYKTLKQVAESIEQHKDDLGVDGAFATPGLDASDTYRFAAHMTRLPLYYEYRDANTTFSKTIKGTYLKNYKDMFDLQLKTSPTEASMVSSKTYDDVTSEFALGQVAFYPNGVWAYSQIKGNDVADEDLGMLPYYMGIKGEEDCGPVGVYDASWAVNKNASEKDKKATLDFIKWMITDNEAKKILSKDMGFSVPFTTFTDDYQPDNPLTEAARAYSNDGKTEVRSFTIPDQQWQDDIASALVEYAQGTGKWDKVQSAFVDGWSTEWNNNEESLGSVPEAQKFDAKS